MKTKHFALLAVCLLALVAGPANAQDAVPRFERLDHCPPWFRSDLLNIECGFLVVPEDRADPDSRTIRLAVAVYRTGHAEAGDVPLVYLAGGPGGASVGASGALMGEGLIGFLKYGDVIFFDQRGTGFSEPSLECPEADLAAEWQLQNRVPLDEQAAQQIEVALLCRDRLRAAGANLSAYHSAASAADVRDLVQTLGYAQANLYGGSYGTRLALAALRDQPDVVRSAILDSVLPPQVDLLAEAGANAERAFDTLFAGCAADAGCSAAYPDLEKTFYDLIDRLNAEPLALDLENPLTGDPQTVILDGYQFGSVIFGLLYNSDAIPFLPRLIVTAQDGDYTLLKRYGPRALYAFVSIADGMNFSVNCAEEMPFSSLEAVQAANAGRAAFVRESVGALAAVQFAVCAVWGAQPLDPIENAPVSSGIPTLVLAGQYDPITPPRWGALAAETLANGHFYEFPGLGHGVLLAARCPREMALAFLAAPSAAPDSSCIAQMRSPRFR